MSPLWSNGNRQLIIAWTKTFGMYLTCYCCCLKFIFNIWCKNTVIYRIPFDRFCKILFSTELLLHKREKLLIAWRAFLQLDCFLPLTILIESGKIHQLLSGENVMHMFLFTHMIQLKVTTLWYISKGCNAFMKV